MYYILVVILTNRLRTIAINVEDRDTFEIVKLKIQHKENIPSHQQRLVLAPGEEFYDACTLDDYRIDSGTTIFLNIPNRSIWVYVLLFHTTFKLQVFSVDTIYNVKYKIAGVAGISPNQQRLTLMDESDPLEDERTVRDYQIQEECRLDCSVDGHGTPPVGFLVMGV